ncbi:hypothetical protein PIB30_013677 [Stylosanthes scabra]|uniref:Uncharacterized protein n=1 Tax=Stylosanthes scabra TaxID=79078 RepID=A0ABU6W4R2_9FABA|nr:hypothetical protein [Stylosanthes scabra]
MSRKCRTRMMKKKLRWRVAARLRQIQKGIHTYISCTYGYTLFKIYITVSFSSPSSLTWILVTSFRGIQILKLQFGSTKRTQGMLGQPRVGTFKVEPMVATGNHPNGLLIGDVVQAHCAFGGGHEVLAGDLGELVEVGGGEGLEWRRREVGVVCGGVPEKADVHHEDGAHPQARQEESQQN